MYEEDYTIYLQSYTQKYKMNTPDGFIGDELYTFATTYTHLKNGIKIKNDCYVNFIIEDHGGIFLTEIHCGETGWGDGRVIFIKLLNLLIYDKKINNNTKISLLAVANSNLNLEKYTTLSFINQERQKKLVEYYKTWGFHIANEKYETITDSGDYDLSQPMTSTVGEIKRAMYENHKILGGKSKSKRNKSRRRRVLRKSRRQIKKRN